MLIYLSIKESFRIDDHSIYISFSPGEGTVICDPYNPGNNKFRSLLGKSQDINDFGAVEQQC